MEQRPLRLGDIVDDYCPRERRITNHAIVAIVDDTIKQTRCTTCDHEHVYKEAREPKRRRKDQTADLYSQVLSGLQKTATPGEPADTAHAEPEPDLEAIADDEAEPGPALVAAPEPVAEEEPAAAEAEEEAAAGDSQPEDAGGDIWPMHRRLIRAQLPRTGNEPPPTRPLPEFTVRQPGARGQRQWGRHAGNGNGNGHHAHGQGRGQGQGQGGGRRNRGGFVPPRPDGRGGQGGGRPGGRGRRSR